VSCSLHVRFSRSISCRAGYQLFAVLQNPQFRQQMTSTRAVVGVVCRGRFKGADRPSAPWADKAGLPSSW